MIRTASLLVVLSALPLPGCFWSRAFVNEPLDANVVAALRPGTTTAAEVTKMLGAPSRIVPLGRRSAYLYEGTQSKTAWFSLIIVSFANTDARSDRVWVFFDENDVLSHVGSSLASHRASYAMPWMSLHDPADRKADDAARFGTTGGER